MLNKQQRALWRLAYKISELEAEIESLKKRERQPRFKPPTIAEVKAYCRERGNQVDAELFVDHYEANGWMIGKTKMKNWPAAVRTWEKSETKNEQQLDKERWSKRMEEREKRLAATRALIGEDVQIRVKKA